MLPTNLKKYKVQALELRKSGFTYSEITKLLRKNIPKSTLSGWCKNISLAAESKLRIKNKILCNAAKARVLALKTNQIKRKKYLESVEKRVSYLKDSLKNKNIAKISLAMLYLGEGSKCTQGSLMFGNSNSKIIKLFLKLLRYCYNIDENKFRCTLQCRADQNIKNLENFWSNMTRIPLNKFYAAKIDSRTIGKKTKKNDYKGVCRIDYFSADIYNELTKINELLTK